MSGALFEHEAFLSSRKNAFWWRIFGLMGLGIGILCIATVAALLPLKEVRAVPFSIDPETKLPVLLTESTPLKIKGYDAAALAEVARYVTARETYDAADNQERISKILSLSQENAAQTWRQLWNANNERHPDKVYGVNARVLVEVLNVSPLRDNLAQARIRKTLFDKTRSQSAIYVATVGFGFEEKLFTSMDALLENPFGFFVESYRIDGETKAGETK